MFSLYTMSKLQPEGYNASSWTVEHLDQVFYDLTAVSFRSGAAFAGSLTRSRAFAAQNAAADHTFTIRCANVFLVEPNGIEPLTS